MNRPFEGYIDVALLLNDTTIGRETATANIGFFRAFGENGYSGQFA
ncbi:hypothetical protein [Chamaesiphon sp.]